MATFSLLPVRTPRKDRMLQPLLFPERQRDNSYFYDEDRDIPIPCLVCSEEFDALTPTAVVNDHCIESVRQRFLHHLITKHKIVIEPIHDIASFKCYAHYWKKRLASETSGNIAALLPVIQTNPETKKDCSEKYFLLSDAQIEDSDLRKFLQTKRLEALLELQHSERIDTDFTRSCVFCHETISGNKAILFEHFLQAHHFNIGQPDNIVMIHQLLDLLQSKIENLQCLYCERAFKDHVTLRDHMRKKMHKRINPSNKSYDKFYIINYLEPGRSWEDIKKEKDTHLEEDESSEDSISNWSDWIELTPSSLTCLFCSHTSPSFSSLNVHMIEKHHHFDFEGLTQDLDYYSRIKLINYIRRQVYNGICIHCSHSYEDILDHMSKENHFMLPDVKTVWDQSQYLFPTYENDELLCAVDDENTSATE